MKTVLIVDDNPVVRRHLRGLLERDGCLVFEATDGVEGLEVLQTRQFDVVFLDLSMPRLDGAGFLKELAAQKVKVPVVLITSSESSAEIMAAVKLGARDYLLKPFREPQLRRAMQVASGLDYTTILRSRADVAILDSDEGLAQTIRTLVPESDVIEHAEQLAMMPEIISRPHQVVFIGQYQDDDGPDEAEALGDLVTQQDPHAVLVRLLDAIDDQLPEVTVFHAGVWRGDEVQLSKVLKAITSAGCLTSGRVVRARRYEGPPELEHLYWVALRVSVQATLLRMVTSGSSATVDLGLAPDRPDRFEQFREWIREFGAARMVEFLVVRQTDALPPPPTGFNGFHSSSSSVMTPPPASSPSSLGGADGTRVLSPSGLLNPAVPTAVSNIYAETTRAAPVPSGSTPPPRVSLEVAPEPRSQAGQPLAPPPVSGPPPMAAPPLVLPGYEFMGLIGDGGMAQVYRAVQKSLRRNVCVKVLREELAADPSLAQRFHDEGIALAALRHPNIVSVLDVGRSEDGKLFIVMEYVDGGDLRAFLKNHDRLSVRQTVEVMGQLLGGLAEAHGSGIIHRDLKPSNVLVTTLKDGSLLVKLVDFGIAKILEGARRTSGATRVGTVVGTPGYMAPEQLLGMEVSTSTDLYAVGVMIFELVTGRRPFVARDEFELAQLTMMTPVPHLTEFVADVPKPLENLINSLLAKNPRDRPQSASAVRAELAQVLLAAA
jgi:serine/threonine protein kinase/CheY-like chemotaxis protein